MHRGPGHGDAARSLETSYVGQACLPVVFGGGPCFLVPRLLPGPAFYAELRALPGLSLKIPPATLFQRGGTSTRCSGGFSQSVVPERSLRFTGKTAGTARPAIGLVAPASVLAFLATTGFGLAPGREPATLRVSLYLKISKVILIVGCY